MENIKVCSGCGAQLPTDAPEGLCPQCLLKAGLETKTGATEPASHSPAAAPPPPAELAKHFPQLEILELLGQGGMGMVYKARQPQLDRMVALKILPLQAGQDAAFAERFVREARSLARLSHPNIVTVHDFGQAGGYFYFLMEFVDGMNLRQMLQAGKISPPEALAIVPKICDALQYAHDEGIVHRDIKPENILLDKRGRVKIADFGLAKLLGAQPRDFNLTASGMVMGTPRYMAPEQMARPNEVDHRADIYSLGVVFYEMLTGEVPAGRFPPPSQRAQVDVRLDEVVLRSLESAPERRYQHASEVRTDVESITNAPPSAATQVSPGTSLDEICRTLRKPAMALLFCGVLNWIADSFILLVLFVNRDSLGWAGQHRVNLGLFAGLTMLLSGLIMFGALKMMKLEAYRLAILSSVLAMITSPGNLLGLPAGIWALVVLTQREVKAAFRQRGSGSAISGQAAAPAAKSQSPGLPGQPGQTAVLPSGPPSKPRFSRKAIVGAIWAPFLLAVLLGFVVIEQVAQSPMPVTVTVHADRPGVPGAQLPVLEPPPPIQYHPTVLQWVLRFTLLPLGAAAPFGATILGLLALHDIRHSRGRVVGLPLALADALLYPLLALDGVIYGFWYLLVHVVVPQIETRPFFVTVGIPLLLTLVTAAVVDFLIVFLAWRAAKKPA